MFKSLLQTGYFEDFSLFAIVNVETFKIFATSDLLKEGTTDFIFCHVFTFLKVYITIISYRDIKVKKLKTQTNDWQKIDEVKQKRLNYYSRLWHKLFGMHAKIWTHDSIWLCEKNF